MLTFPAHSRDDMIPKSKLVTHTERHREYEVENSLSFCACVRDKKFEVKKGGGVFIYTQTHGIEGCSELSFAFSIFLVPVYLVEG